MLPLRHELEQRWLLYQYSDEAVFDLYDTWWQSFYCGYDPTADSFTIGHLVSIMNAVHYMRRGNTFYLMLGGATGMIGDPSGKNAERAFLSDETVRHNVDAIGRQMTSLLANIEEMLGQKLHFEMANNADFYTDMSYLRFLRDVGKYITVNAMMHKETVKRRLTDPDQSISYTEFSYMLLQGYDFLRRYQDKWLKLQTCGSDQWGNCVTGLELIDKIADGKAYVASTPLLLDASGKKFGKSEGNALRLDPTKNSPYTVYQYFMNTADADIERYLKILTLLEFDTIEQIIATHHSDPATRYGQEQLAWQVIRIIFGQDALRQAQMISQILFSKENPLDMIATMSVDDIQALQEETGGEKNSQFTMHNAQLPIIELLVQTWLASSNGDAKKLIESRGVSYQERVVEDIHATVSASDAVNGVILLRKGKKNFRVVLVC